MNLETYQQASRLIHELNGIGYALDNLSRSDTNMPCPLPGTNKAWEGYLMAAEIGLNERKTALEAELAAL